MANLAAQILFHLAKNPDVQERLYHEVKLSLPHKDDELFLVDMKYFPMLYACIIEALRLRPPFPYAVRSTSKDMVIHGFAVPQGTQLFLAHDIAYHNNEYFSDPHKFQPKRWLGRLTPKIDPLHVMPFAYRQHPNLKNLYYLQVAALISRVVKEYKILFHYGEINFQNKITGLTRNPLRFTFLERRS